MQKLAGAILGGLVVLTGCATAPSRAPLGAEWERPPDWEHGAPVLNEPVFAPVSPAGPGVPTNPLPMATPEATWLSLTRWAESRGLAVTRQALVPPTASWVLTGAGGVLILTPGSQIARWNQMEVRLGFAPQLANGQPLVHALDVTKNLEPLLRGFVPNTRPGRLVMIDPGHGGANLGTRSAVGEPTEKHYTLDWALRLAPLLEAVGWRVALTRTDDQDVSLTDRVALAEALGADLFISLHFNSAGGNGPAPSGLETFCLTPTGMRSTLTRGDADDPALIFPNNAYDEDNLMYAAQLHAALLRAGGQVDRGVRRARFLTVLQGQNRPAVLIEGGFLSNPAEARRVADPSFRQLLAEAVAEALR